MPRSRWCRVLAGIAASVLGTIAAAEQPTTDSGYTATQAAAGKTTYDQYCVECHSADLRGAFGPELAGPSFRNAWGSRTTRELFERIKATMPPGAEGSLGDEAYVNLVAYILQSNGHAAGVRELRPSSAVAIDAVTGAPSQASQAPAVPQRSAAVGLPGPAQSADERGHGTPAPPFNSGRTVRNFTPVTDEVLRNPPAADWLTWRRTLDGKGYSPLKQITRDNVHDLRAAWVWAMAEGGVQTTPLVHDGVMYLANSGDIVQALDARTGDLIWEYRRRSTTGGSAPVRSRTRTIAIYHDKIFMTTSDAAVIALDARTGHLVWETYKADPQQGFAQTAGPTIAGGVVVSGLDGCNRFRKEGCFITGHDPEKGTELWRTSTIALPGDPNNATWGNIPPGLRGGGETWIPGSYDPDLNLFFIGTAQAKPWNPASRGMTTFDAALYTNSTLALDPKTGQIVWYFQHVPGEALDLDTVFERVLVDVGNQKLLFTVGKDGIMWKLDRRSGAFLGARETVFQNIFESIDPKTGRVRYRPDIIEAKIGDWIASCPGYLGGHNWIASAYSAETDALIVPLFQHCGELRPLKVELVEGSGGNAADARVFEMPGSDGNLGKLSAFAVQTMQHLWSHEQRAPFTTGALATAGGLVFIGDMDRSFKAFDSKTGALLWQFRVGASPLGYPITYSIGAKQYVAVPTGVTAGLMVIRPLLSPEIYAPATGSALYVFELPERR